MALIVAFVAAISNGETPLNVLQLLWVNLIMDSLAALGEHQAASTLINSAQHSTASCVVVQREGRASE